jgi:two-component system chemotaxis response regulator CheB
MRDGDGAGKGERLTTDPFPVRFPVVALIASAGGVDALARVLRSLPGDLPAAVLIALHQDPTHGSHLAAILQRRSRLPIDFAAQDTVMRPGCALVVPAGWHMLVTPEARLALIEAGPLPPARPSADLLLSTLAVTCGPRALAVILTGMGHDGQAGTPGIARCGGTVLAQDEATAEFFGMPAAAIATHQVQQILGIDAIADAVVGHVGGTRPGGSGPATVRDDG